MLRAKRGRLVSHLRPSINKASGPHNKGWLSIRTNTSNQSHWSNDDGTPLTDEIILFIFTSFLEIADLVRCAATCKRWRHLVSGHANFICRTSQQLCFINKFIPSLIVGFFHKHDATMLNFIPMASASRRFPFLHKPSLSLAMNIDNELLNSSHIVASRNGLLVIEVQRGKHSRTLKLCVCNPMSGEVHVLPALRGKDGLGHYACTVLTTVDYQNMNRNNNSQPPLSSHYHLIIVYSRLHFTAFRSYSSKDGIWRPEGKVTGAQLGKNQIRLMRNGVIAYGGQVAYWITIDLVFGLHLNTLDATMIRLPWSRGNTFIDTKNILLGTTPKGRLCAIQFSKNWSLSMHGKWEPTNEIHVITYDNNGSTNNNMLQMSNSLWKTKINIQIDQALKVDALAMEVKLQWFCEKSGVVFFTISYYGKPRSEVYALNLGTRMIEKVASNTSCNDLWNNFYGYEMDHASYLTTLT